MVVQRHVEFVFVNWWWWCLEDIEKFSFLFNKFVKMSDLNKKK